MGSSGKSGGIGCGVFEDDETELLDVVLEELLTLLELLEELLTVLELLEELLTVLETLELLLDEELSTAEVLSVDETPEP